MIKTNAMPIIKKRSSGKCSFVDLAGVKIKLPRGQTEQGLDPLIMSVLFLNSYSGRKRRGNLEVSKILPGVYDFPGLKLTILFM